MVRITTIYEPRPVRISEVRMSLNPSDGSDKPAYESACNLIWDSDTVVTISMLNGATPRALLRELVEKLDALGVRTIRAERAEGRLLPRLFKASGLRAGDHYEMDVREAIEHYGPRRPSQFGDL